MITVLTTAAVLAMIGFAVWLTRDNWFRVGQQRSSRIGYAPSIQPTSPTQQPQQQVTSAQQQAAPVSQQTAGAQTSKSTRNSFRPILGWGLGILLVWIGFSAYQRFSPSGKSQGNVTAGISPTFGASASSEDVVLAQICGCESSGGIPPGKQLDENGQVIVNADSGAKGACQIHPTNFAEAEEMGLNLDTEAGNREFARYLYRRDGTAPWTETASCWAEKITMPGGLIVTLKAPVGEWSGPFPVRPGFNFVTGWIGLNPRHQVEYTTREGSVVVSEYPTKNGENDKVRGDVGIFRVKSLEKEPVIVTLTLTPKT